MWMTGFDVPTCSTIYLDKPMKNHTLMQTIARANRVAPGKQAGLIVDYVGVFRNLQEALAIYAQPRPGVTTDPIEGKDELVEALTSRAWPGRAFAEARSVSPADVLAVTGFERQAALQAGGGEPARQRRGQARVSAARRRRLEPVPGGAARPGRERISGRHDRVAGRRRDDPHDDAKAAGQERARRHRRNRAPDRRGDLGRGDQVRPLPTGEDMKRLFDLSTLDFERLAELFARRRRGRPRPKSCAAKPRSGRGRSRAATRHASIFSNG